jgi:hypothetical protein
VPAAKIDRYVAFRPSSALSSRRFWLGQPMTANSNKIPVPPGATGLGVKP